MTEETEILEKLDEIKSVLKIIAFEHFNEIKPGILSTKNKEKIYELCTGENEMGEIAKKANVSKEAVRLSVIDFQNIGLVRISKKIGKKTYPKRVL